MPGNGVALTLPAAGQNQRAQLGVSAHEADRAPLPAEVGSGNMAIGRAWELTTEVYRTKRRRAYASSASVCGDPADRRIALTPSVGVALDMVSPPRAAHPCAASAGPEAVKLSGNRRMPRETGAPRRRHGNQATGPGAVSFQAVLTSILRGLASARFGIRMLNTPSLSLASILSVSSSWDRTKLRR